MTYYKKAGLFFCIGIILLLAVPTAQGFFKFFPEHVGLYGYTDPIPDKPRHYLRGFFDKSFQTWIEKKFNAQIGFRAFLIRSFNEVNFRLFHEADSSFLKLFLTKTHGLYSDQTIESLNYDVIYKKELEKSYRQDAKKLLKIQTLLAKQGKCFMVVIASSKAYIYPKELGHRLLIGGSQHIFNRAANFAAILKDYGINVVNSKALLDKVAHQDKIETHPSSGVHWNHYAGCLVAKEILSQAKSNFPNLATIDCEPYQRRMPPLNDVDVDGYSMLNIWSKNHLIRLTTYPTISLENTTSYWRPKIVVIGDSFSDQIRSVFKETHVYSQMVMSSYFKRREVEDQNEQVQETSSNSSFESQVLADIAEGDIIILEMVDYNLHRKNEPHLYGFAEYFLKKYN